MKRFARALGILGGIGALVWTIRDRIMSIVSPAEPEPPSFRVVTPPSSPAGEASGGAANELLEVDGIGPVFASKLIEAGITTLPELVAAGAERVAAIVELPASRVQGWIDHAASLVS